MKKPLLTTIMILVLEVIQASQPRKVLIIGIDGARSDAFQDANTPNIDAILSNSFFTYESWHHAITISGPSWSSILTGAEYTKHGVKDNSYSNSAFNIYPYFTTRAKRCLPDLYCVQVTQWAPMSDQVYNDGWNKKIIVDDGAGDQTVSKTLEELNDPNLDVLFTYFDEVDLAGHASGFSRYNPEYVHAIETVDSHIGKIIVGLHNRTNYETEQWIVLLVTDHGGILTGHGGHTPGERKIWWIGAGNRTGKHEMTNVQDPGSIAVGIFNPAIAAKSPGQCDIALTALDHLLRGSACGINPEWNLDGKSWLDSIYTDPITGITEHADEAFDFLCYPNPADCFVTVVLNNPREAISYEVTDANGKQVEQNTITEKSRNNFQLDFCNKTKGVYFVTIITGRQRTTRKMNIK